MVRNKHYVQVSFQECLQTTWAQKFLELQCQENPSYLSVPEKLGTIAADWHNLILTWEGFITADSISLKIRLLNKEKIKLESSSQVSNKKEENIYPESKNILWRSWGLLAVLLKHKWK